MKQDCVSSKQVVGRDEIDPEDVQEQLVQKACVHHDHGGREHGHDWDDWLKDDRSLKSKGKKDNRVRPKPPKLW